MTYLRLAVAADCVRAGAHFIATNRDPVYPTERGLRPGAGSLVAAVEAATGVVPVSIGKPAPYLLEAAAHAVGREPAEAIMIGDGIGTDLAAARAVGARCILMLTGVTTRAEVDAAARRPSDPTPSAADAAELAALSRDSPRADRRGRCRTSVGDGPERRGGGACVRAVRMSDANRWVGVHETPEPVALDDERVDGVDRSHRRRSAGRRRSARSRQGSRLRTSRRSRSLCRSTVARPSTITMNVSPGSPSRTRRGSRLANRPRDASPAISADGSDRSCPGTAGRRASDIGGRRVIANPRTASVAGDRIPRPFVQRSC